jgi:hypothetical protein
VPTSLSGAAAAAPPAGARVTHFKIKMRTHLSPADLYIPPSLTKIPLHGTGAPHHAPPSVWTFKSAANTQQTHVQWTWSCTANTRNPPRPRLSPSRQTYISPHPTIIPYWSPCLRTLTSHQRTYRVTYATAGSARVCAHRGPLHPPEPSSGPSAHSIHHSAPTTPSRPRLGHCT